MDNELFLQEFNEAISRDSEEIKKDKYMCNDQFYNYIMGVVTDICKEMSYEEVQSGKQLPVIHIDEMFDLALDFFKSVDVELYNKANAIVNGEYPNTKTYIYDFHKDDPEHTTHYGIMYEDGKARVFLPLGKKISETERNRIIQEHGEDYYTIDDLYSTVHEVSHLFDIDPEKYTKSPSKTRDVLAETTPHIFENLLSEYLLKKGIFNEDVIKEKSASISNLLTTHANVFRIRAIFIELKRRKGEITDEDIQSMMKNDMLGEDEFFNIINLIAHSDVSMAENKRYAFAAKYAPLIIQKSKEFPDKKLLQKYLYECSQNVSVADILSVFDIGFKDDDGFKDDGDLDK